MKQANFLDHLFNFLAVILGVTLAFYVNSYSAGLKEREEYRYFIQTLYDELVGDIETYEDYQIPDNDKTTKNTVRLVEILTLGEANDSLDFYAGNVFQLNSYSPQNVAFNSMVSSGKIGLIQNLELRSMLQQYNTFSNEVEAQGEAQYDYFMKTLIPWFIENPSYAESIDLNADNSSYIIMVTIYANLIENKLAKYKEIYGEAKYL
ncbi:MAG: hypothetical protein HRT61_17900, partial [Ekhidna sp.]|nr:hypothetical protein [Ekhidna sp.]